MKKEINFTHYWIEGFGWGKVSWKDSDFKEIEKLGESDEGIVYLGFNSDNKNLYY